MKKTKSQLIEIHKALHGSLDRLLACYISTTKKGLADTNLLELIEWSHEQTKDPSCYET